MHLLPGEATVIHLNQWDVHAYCVLDEYEYEAVVERDHIG